MTPQDRLQEVISRLKCLFPSEYRVKKITLNWRDSESCNPEWILPVITIVFDTGESISSEPDFN